jgi:2-desacetyl-2-hydroxyethyl bacteriochlorophyllide A dehydrogenase
MASLKITRPLTGKPFALFGEGYQAGHASWPVGGGVVKARALHFVGPRRVELREVELPEPADGRVLVATEWSGISSGTELLAYRGEIDPDLPLDEVLGALGGTFTYPFRYGYSAVGRVVGPAGPLQEGQLVFAFHPHQDRFVVDAGELTPVDRVDPRTATMYPLVETALQVCLDAAPRLGETVVVVGLGAVGIVSSALLARTGAVVLASEPEPSRRATADAFGVRAMAPDDVAAAVAAETRGRGADLVVEASGNPRALASCLGLLAHEGTVVVCSWYGTKPASLPLGAAFHRRRLALRSSQVSTLPAALSARWDRRRRAEVAWQLARELPLALLASHEFPFEQAADAYARLDRKQDGVIHAALRYR